ncbi:MAG: GYDIA family GHMP kinase [Lentimicrobiaceae bacterium]|nr:GYDIA family GHMP kinase [Lentimicrobiaceae bacterium]
MSSGRNFKANGKILLSGEYLVMQGALALALPLRLKQHLTVTPVQAAVLHWEAHDTGGQWFSAQIQLPDLNIITASDAVQAKQLVRWLKAAQTINPGFLNKAEGYDVITRLEFNRHWGFGSSSTLLYCIAQWAVIDPFKLHQSVSSGSGYDIACAGADRPLIYQLNQKKPVVSLSFFDPGFTPHLYLVYSGMKQQSDKEVENFRLASKEINSQVDVISEISLAMEREQDLTGFMKLMKEHELIIAGILGRDTVKSLKFSNFEGEIKSLGAWGGDFILAASIMEPVNVIKYFAEKGYHTILPFASTVAGLSSSAEMAEGRFQS